MKLEQCVLLAFASATTNYDDSGRGVLMEAGFCVYVENGQLMIRNYKYVLNADDGIYANEKAGIPRRSGIPAFCAV